MDRSGRKSFGHLGGANHSPSIVKHFDKIVVLDFSGLCVLAVYPDYPIVISVNKDTVIFDVVDRAILTVTHSVETETGMRRDQL